MFGAVVWVALTGGFAHAGPLLWNYATEFEVAYMGTDGDLSLWQSNFIGVPDGFDAWYSMNYLYLEGRASVSPLGVSATVSVASTISYLPYLDGSWSVFAPPLSAFAINVKLTDETSGQTGTLSFPGYVDGPINYTRYSLVSMDPIAGEFLNQPLNETLEYRWYSDADAAGRWWLLDDPNRGLTQVSRSLRVGNTLFEVTFDQDGVDWGSYPLTEYGYDPYWVGQTPGSIDAKVTVIYVTPEPSSWFLAIVSLCGLGVTVWRFRG
jgi:hypothetical protein